MFDIVLDSSAVLAHLRGEPGADLVQPKLQTGLVCAVNLAEIAGRLSDWGQSSDEVSTVIGLLALTVRPFDESLAFRAGALRSRTRSLGLSLGDRACLAMAEQEGLPVMTADRAWATLDLAVTVQLIR
jgi:PIN domain nuclease of toxin-antitoxin system